VPVAADSVRSYNIVMPNTETAQIPEDISGRPRRMPVGASVGDTLSGRYAIAITVSSFGASLFRSSAPGCSKQP